MDNKALKKLEADLWESADLLRAESNNMMDAISRNMKRRMSKKGFTLAELLIVVAIIAVLVAISIPIFSNQLEKSRDAVSIANIRTAYTEAQAEYINPDLSLKRGKGLVLHDSDGNITMSINFESPTSSTITSIVVYNVEIKGKRQNNWSGMGDDLPFVIKDNHIAGTWRVFFYYDTDGSFSKPPVIA